MTTASALPPPLVSCLCVTHRRVALLQRALLCFDRQTWPHRELVLLHEDGDTETRDFLARLAHPQVRSLVVPSLPRLSLGLKRRLTVEAAQGHYVATWDDDDWSAPTRLEQQIAVMRASGLAASTLERWIVHDHALGQSWLTYPRTWEASLVCERAAMPRYQDLMRQEDTRCLEELLRRRQVANVRLPHTYVYTYHGSNVGSRAHFKRYIFRGSQLLPAVFSARVAALLAAPATQRPITAEELQAAVQSCVRP